MKNISVATFPFNKITQSIGIAVILGLTLVGCGSSSTSDSNTVEDDTSSSGDTVESVENNGIYRVSSTSSSDSEDGASWDTAYTNIQDAIDAAATAGGGEVWVASGTYTSLIDDDGNEAAYSERLLSVEMQADVDLYGGFSGSETERTERDWKNNITTLSGEIGDTSTVNDNSYHVVTGANNAIIDGFTISGGYAIPGQNDNADATYVACDATDAMDVAAENKNDELLRVLYGYCYGAGGGMINVQTAPTVANVTFENNSAIKGGAVYNMVLDSWPMSQESMNNTAATFENVIFKNNMAMARGGAVNNDLMTSPSFVDVQFIGNMTPDKGGALYNDAGCSPYIYNALFLYNEAERGSAIVGDGSSSPILAYTTFYGNVAADIGAGLYQGTYGAEQGQYNEMQINSSLLLGNSSGSSSSSITSWNDSQLLVDEHSVIEYTDGEFANDNNYDEYLSISSVDDDISVVNTNTYSDIGWDENRDSSNWATEIAALEQEHSDLFTALPYEASCVANSSSADASDFYVYDGANGDGSGSSWNNAYTSLSDAIENADCYDNIHVSASTGASSSYYPSLQSGLSNEREAAFILKEGMVLQGGYCDGSDTTGCTTILSGDLNQDSTWNNGAPSSISDDSYHVLIGAEATTVDSFTIEFGNADSAGYHKRGAGMLNYYVSPTVSNSQFRYNSAIEGAALANYKDSSPTLYNLTFTNNMAERGAAILYRDSSEGTLSDSTFSYNDSSDRGGAIYIDYGSTLTFTGLYLNDNNSGGSGGAIYLDDNASQYGLGTNLDLINSDFYDNAAASVGGGIALYNSSTNVNVAGGTYNGNSANGLGDSINAGYSSTLTLDADNTPAFDVEPVYDNESAGNMPPQ